MRKLFNAFKSDESLMLAYQHGDGSAFEVLYMRYKDSLFTFLFRSCPERAVVEELVHEAWFSIIRSIETYQPRAKFKTYLYTVAHSKLIDHWRRNNKYTHSVDVNELELPSDGACTEAITSNEQIRGRLADGIANLQQDQRDAFLLREEGFSLDQIAAIVGVGRETVKSRLRYASNQLRKTMQSEYRTDEKETSGRMMSGIRQ